jgi:hypothetical protein
MEMKGERELPVGRETACALLNDREVLKVCIPGCESIAVNGAGSYDILMNAAIGPVKAQFKGKLSVTEIEPNRRYRMLFEGQSGQAGFARGEAKVELEEVSPKHTRLIYEATLQVGGKLAQLGARLIDAAVAMTADRFFECFAAQLSTHMPSNTAEARSKGALERSGFWHWFMIFLKRLFAR